LLNIVLIELFFNQVLPSGVGSDAVRGMAFATGSA
jgi:hypothetical protein